MDSGQELARAPVEDHGVAADHVHHVDLAGPEPAGDRFGVLTGHSTRLLAISGAKGLRAGLVDLVLASSASIVRITTP